MSINKTTFTFLFSIIPGLIIWFFLSFDIHKKEIINFWFLFLILSIYSILVIGISFLFNLLKKLPKTNWKIDITISVSFSAIILSYPLDVIWRFVIVLSISVFLTLITLFLEKYLNNKTIKNQN